MTQAILLLIIRFYYVPLFDFYYLSLDFIIFLVFDVFLLNFVTHLLSFINSDRSSIVYPAAAAAATFLHLEQSYIFTISA